MFCKEAEWGWHHSLLVAFIALLKGMRNNWLSCYKHLLKCHHCKLVLKFVLLLKNAVLIWNNECMNDFLSPILSGISFIEQAVTPKKYLWKMMKIFSETFMESSPTWYSILLVCVLVCKIHRLTYLYVCFWGKPGQRCVNVFLMLF